jgi:four helix bundle protein
MGDNDECGIMNKNKDIPERTKACALRIIRLYTALPKSTAAQVIGNQVLRSGTSVGAPVRVGKRSRSDAELVSKLEGGLQELGKTVYWLALLVDSGIVKAEHMAGLMTEADELISILVSGAKTVKQRSKRR